MARRAPAQRRLSTIEMQNRAVELRTEGMSYAAIAAELGVSTTYVHDLVQDALSSVPVTKVDTLRKVENARLDNWQRRLELELQAIPVGTDPGMAAKLIAQLVQLSARRCKLNGLEAMTEEQEISAQLLGEMFMRLLAQLREQGRQVPDHLAAIEAKLLA